MINFLFTKTPLIFFVQSFWRDEAFTYALAKENLLNIFLFTAKDFNPPLYYLIIHFWIKVFGPSEISLRLFSLICYWGLVYTGFLFLSNIFKFSTKKSFFYLIFFILNPLFIYYAFEARMYTFFALLSSLSFYFFIQKKYIIYIGVTIAGLYTHYFMIFVVLGQLFFFYLTNKKKCIKQLKPFIIIALSFVPWLIFLFLNRHFLIQSFWVEKPDFFYFLKTLGKIYTGYESNIYPTKIKTLFSLINILIILILLTGLRNLTVFKKKVKNQTFLLMFIWGVITPLFIGLISFAKSIYLPRYLIFSTFGLLLLLIAILEKLPKKTKIFFILLLFLLTIVYNKQQIKYRTKFDSRKVIGEIKKIAKEYDLLYVINDLDFFTAKYYFDDKRVFIYRKSYQDIPNYVGKVLIPEKKITYYLPFYPQKAFILGEDGSYDIQAMY